MSAHVPAPGLRDVRALRPLLRRHGRTDALALLDTHAPRRCAPAAAPALVLPGGFVVREEEGETETPRHPRPAIAPEWRIIGLSEDHVVHAYDLASARVVANGRIAASRYAKDRSDLEVHTQGLLGELAFRLWTGASLTDMENVTPRRSAVDADADARWDGRTVDIKTTWAFGAPLLVEHAKARCPAALYALCYVDRADTDAIARGAFRPVAVYLAGVVPADAVFREDNRQGDKHAVRLTPDVCITI